MLAAFSNFFKSALDFQEFEKRTSTSMGSGDITDRQTDMIIEKMLIGFRNLHQKFETVILNRSQENHVSPHSFQTTEKYNYRVPSLLKI